MKALFSFFIIILISNLSIAQPNIEWQKSLGGSDLEYLRLNSVEQTSDGGYIVAGTSASTDGDVTGNHGGYDYWIVKLNSTGNISWQKSLGGTGYDEAWSIHQTSNGGYIVAGTSTSNDGDVSGNHGDTDYWVVKLTNTGSISWQKSLGGTGKDDNYDIQQTSDGGYIVTGASKSTDGDVTGNHGDFDYWVVKLTSTGSIAWQKSLGGTGNDQSISIQQTSDGGYIIAGLSDSNDGDVTGNHGFDDYWIVKLTSTGSIAWQKSFGGINNDRAWSIKQTSDGGYIVAGASRSNDGDVTGNHGDNDYWVIKLTNTGNISWQKSLGGSLEEEANHIQNTADGGYIIAGFSLSNDGDVTGNNGNADYWIVKLTSTGSLAWQKCLGGTDVEVAFTIQQTLDGGFIVAGMSESNDGDVTGNNGNFDYWIVKLSPFVGIEENNFLNLSYYPNPTSGKITIKLGAIRQGVKATLSNSLGQVVFVQQFESNDNISINIDAPIGIYLLQLETSSGELITKKIIKE